MLRLHSDRCSKYRQLPQRKTVSHDEKKQRPLEIVVWRPWIPMPERDSLDPSRL